MQLTDQTRRVVLEQRLGILAVCGYEACGAPDHASAAAYTTSPTGERCASLEPFTDANRLWRLVAPQRA
jgi:hypothetical protein